ncbi:hypothetical protein KGY79_01790 [Candidatus Bipolaricaulota bacterium]|nr:hypothetical protein [Candidatus Bipolaricaulota bacterium]
MNNEGDIKDIRNGLRVAWKSVVNTLNAAPYLSLPYYSGKSSGRRAT